jgi:adenylylsulfate kinase
MKILIMGLPGAGKTTLADALARELQCAHFNADDIRKNINKDLGFSLEDRIEQARRMGHLCDIVAKYSHVIADFVCPTPECRVAFNPHFIVWVDRIQSSRYKDTNQLFVPPENFDYRVTKQFDFAQYHAEEIKRIIQSERKLNAK